MEEDGSEEVVKGLAVLVEVLYGLEGEMCWGGC